MDAELSFELRAGPGVAFGLALGFALIVGFTGGAFSSYEAGLSGAGVVPGTRAETGPLVGPAVAGTLAGSLLSLATSAIVLSAEPPRGDGVGVIVATLVLAGFLPLLSL